MKFVSFNVNGVRAHIHQIQAIIKKLNPDIIGLQETKVNNSLFPIKEISQYGYHVYCHGQNQHYGVALCFRKPPLNIIPGFIDENNFCSQKRSIIAQISTKIGILTIINNYFPQGENKNCSIKFLFKKIFYQKLQDYIESHYNNKSLLLIMGDMNISPTNLDIGISYKNQKRWISLGKCSFLPEERIWINQLIDWGLIDIYRATHSTNNQRYSWFDYRSHGFKNRCGLRVDLILTTRSLMSYHKKNDIDYDIRNMSNPSDHAPIWADFNI